MKQKVKYIFGLARVDELRLLNNCVSHCQILFSLLKEVSGGKRSNISYKFFSKASMIQVTTRNGASHHHSF